VSGYIRQATSGCVRGDTSFLSARNGGGGVWWRSFIRHVQICQLAFTREGRGRELVLDSFGVASSQGVSKATGQTWVGVSLGDNQGNKYENLALLGYLSALNTYGCLLHLQSMLFLQVPRQCALTCSPSGLHWKHHKHWQHFMATYKTLLLSIHCGPLKSYIFTLDASSYNICCFRAVHIFTHALSLLRKGLRQYLQQPTKSS
jgi:hypothetical protein